MTRVRTHKRPEVSTDMQGLLLVHKCIMKRVDWSSHKELANDNKWAAAEISSSSYQQQQPRCHATPPEVERRKRKRNSRLGSSSSSKPDLSDPAGDDGSRACSWELVAGFEAATDDHQADDTTLPLVKKLGGLEQNVVTDHQIEIGGTEAAAAFISCNQAQNKSGFKHPSPDHVCNPANVNQVVVSCPGGAAEELSAEGEDDENITRHSYVQTGGIRNLAGASCMSQTCAAAEEQEQEEASLHEENLGDSGFLLSQQAAAASLPISEVESAKLLSHKEPGICQLTDPARMRVPISLRSYKLKRNFIPCKESDHPSLEPQGSLLHSLYLQLLQAGGVGITLEESLAIFGSQTLQPGLGSNWQEQVKNHLESNPYFDKRQGRYILCELLVEQTASPACVKKSVIRLTDAIGDSETALDHQAQVRQLDAACVQSDHPPLLVRLSFDSIQVQEGKALLTGMKTMANTCTPDAKLDAEVEVKQSNNACCQSVDSNSLCILLPSDPLQSQEGVQTRRKTYQKTFEAVLNASAEEFKNLQNAKMESAEDVSRTEKLAEPRAPGTEKSAEPNACESTTLNSPVLEAKSELRKALGGSIPVRNTNWKPSEFEAALLARGIKYGGAIPGTLKTMQAMIEAEKGIQTGVRCARKDGSHVSSKWQCPMLARENHTLCEHHIYLNARKKARYANARKQASATGVCPPKKFQPESGQSTKAKVPSLMPNRECIKVETKGKGKIFTDVESLNPCQQLQTPTVKYPCSQSSAPLFEALVHVSLSSQPLPPETTVPTDTLFSKEKEVLPQMVPETNSVQQHPYMNPSTKYRAAMKKASKLMGDAVEGMKPVKQMFPAVQPPAIPPMPVQYGVRQKLPPAAVILATGLKEEDEDEAAGSTGL